MKSIRILLSSLFCPGEFAVAILVIAAVSLGGATQADAELVAAINDRVDRSAAKTEVLLRRAAEVAGRE